MVSAPVVLGGGSSCDETGAGIVRDGKPLAHVLASSVDEHARFGGVVPEIAARPHLQAFTPVVRQALPEAGLRLGQADAVAVSTGPASPAPSTGCTTSPGDVTTLIMVGGVAATSRVRRVSAARGDRRPSGRPLLAAHLGPRGDTLRFCEQAGWTAAPPRAVACEPRGVPRPRHPVRHRACGPL